MYSWPPIRPAFTPARFARLARVIPLSSTWITDIDRPPSSPVRMGGGLVQGGEQGVLANPTDHAALFPGLFVRPPLHAQRPGVGIDQARKPELDQGADPLASRQVDQALVVVHDPANDLRAEAAVGVAAHDPVLKQLASDLAGDAIARIGRAQD